MLCRLLLRNTVYLCRDVPLSHWCSYYPTTERHGLATRLYTRYTKGGPHCPRGLKDMQLSLGPLHCHHLSLLCRRLLLCPMQRCHLGRELLLWPHLCRGLLLWHLCRGLLLWCRRSCTIAAPSRGAR